MRILISVPYDPTFEPPTGVFGDHSVAVRRRASDWGLRGARKHFHHVLQSLQILRAARSYDSLVLCTVGTEAFIIAKFKRWFGARHLRLVVFDLLIPKENRLAHFVRTWIASVDTVAVIRRGDAPMLNRRFGYPLGRCVFLPFPAPSLSAEATCPEDDYIYSAGYAHRDWPTLIQALSNLPYRAIICPGRPVEIPADAQDRIKVRPMPPPGQGRRLMASAKLVVLPFLETELPSGPLILLDAMAFGKPIVASDVNGTRDYAEDGVDALLVAPRDAEQLRERIRQAMENEGLRRKLAEGAKAKAASLSFKGTFCALLSLCGEKNVQAATKKICSFPDGA